MEGPQGSTEAAAKLARGLKPRRVRRRGSASAIKEDIPGRSLILCAVDSRFQNSSRWAESEKKSIDFRKGQGLITHILAANAMLYDHRSVRNHCDSSMRVASKAHDSGNSAQLRGLNSRS